MRPSSDAWSERFKLFMLNNKFTAFLLILLLIGLNILVLNKVNFIFKPLVVLLKTVMLPIILSGVLYYLLDPVVTFLQERKIRRVYSIAMLYIIILGIIALVIGTVIPLMKDQILSFIQHIPELSRAFNEQLEHLLGSRFFNQVTQSIEWNTDEMMNTISSKLTTMLNHTWASLSGFVGVMTETILSIAMIPLLLFYLLNDGHRLPSYISAFFPVPVRRSTLQVLQEMSAQISSYIRGQIIVSFCIGFLLFIGYNVIGLEYSLVLAVVAAFTSIVPYLGPVIAITPALVVAIVTSPIMLLKMIVIWTLVQLIEGKFISPQIMGKSLNVHPVTIIFVLLTAGHLFGIVGIILAVPGYAVLKVVLSHLFDWFKRTSGLYEAEAESNKNIN